MRAYAILLFLVVAVSAENTPAIEELLRPHGEICRKDVEASKEDLEALVELRLEAFTDKTKCLATCVFEKMGVMKDGQFLPYDSSKDEYQLLELFQDVVEECGKEAYDKFAGRKCDVAFSAMECVLGKIA